MEEIPTFTANIYVGLRESYTDHIYTLNLARKVCQEYVNKVGLCVTLTPTEFIYTNGNEPGFIVGLINYPRFPLESYVIKDHAVTLASILKVVFKQNRVSIIYPDSTVML